MPPAISDEETSDIEVASAPVKRSSREKSTSAKVEDVEPEQEEEAADEDEEGGDEEEDIYVVEKIMGHRFEKGVLKFEVKWEGYEKKSDRTWEPEENLIEAEGALEEYYASVGGKDKVMEELKTALKTKKRGRASVKDETPSSSAKRSRTNGVHPRNRSPPATARQAEWNPPVGSWEHDVAELDACEDEVTKKLIVYVTWKNGHKTQHETSVIYKRCPQKMLEFYERHVRIVKKDEPPEDDFDETEYQKHDISA